jgi:hypothetical protein
MYIREASWARPHELGQLDLAPITAGERERGLASCLARYPVLLGIPDPSVA